MDQKKQQDVDRPNQAANKEPAEGSRENAGGITNRPLEREQREQKEVPPRGRTKEEDVGRTAGGGSLGHDQPSDVKRESPPRNATGDDRDPVMSRDDATLKTKI